MTPGLRTTLRAAGLVVLTFLCWLLWLGLDTTYQVDPATGVKTGPYEAPQVAGCVLCLVVLAAAGAWLLPWWLVVVAMTVTFVVSWSVNAAAGDNTGLWGVGAFMLLVGMLVAGTVITLPVYALRTRRGLGSPNYR